MCVILKRVSNLELQQICRLCYCFADYFINILPHSTYNFTFITLRKTFSFVGWTLFGKYG
jgi:hypothetical protein